VQEFDPDRIGGHGLRIVQSLSARWGCTRFDGAGKTVWFEITDPHAP
jgi:hypothetical protein